MTVVLECLRFAAQSLEFLSPHQLEARARLVEADFAAISLKYQLSCQKIPVPGWRGHLPYASYQLLGSQCDINHAHRGDRRHTSMSGGGLDRECVLYFSKISEWAHANIPHLWPNALRDDLADPNSHLDTLCEVWWLSKVIGGDFKTVRHGVPAEPGNKKGKNFDWQVRLPAAGVTLNLEVKRRPGDVGRSIDVPKLKWKSIFNDVDKFPEPNPPDVLNVGCIRLFGPISRDVYDAARGWLAATPQVSALVFHGPSLKDHEAFAVIAQPGLEYIRLFFSPPDHEDNTHVAPFWFARDVPGLSLPDIGPDDISGKPTKP
jgi:hypothetical protein